MGKIVVHDEDWDGNFVRLRTAVFSDSWQLRLNAVETHGLRKRVVLCYVRARLVEFLPGAVLPPHSSVGAHFDTAGVVIQTGFFPASSVTPSD